MIGRKRPLLQASVLCDNVAVDNLGRPAFLACWSVVKSNLAPPIPLSFVVSNIWTNGIGLWHQHTAVHGPAGELIARSEESELFLSSVARSYRIDERFAIQLVEGGQHTVRVYLDNDVVAEYHFIVDSPLESE